MKQYNLTGAEPEKTYSKNNLKGISFSALLVVFVNYLAGIQVFALFLLECAALFMRPHDQPLSFAIIVYLILALCAAFIWLSIKAAHALYAGQRWSAYITFIWSVFFLALNGGFIYNWKHPEHQAPDEDFAFLILPPLAAIALWWCIYLNLPHVRAFFKASSEQDKI